MSRGSLTTLEARLRDGRPERKDLGWWLSRQVLDESQKSSGPRGTSPSWSIGA
jgi:hypothetical protein